MTKKQMITLIIPGIIYILINVILKFDISNYSDSFTVSYSVEGNKMVVNLEQPDKIKFLNCKVKYRIKEQGKEYGNWQDNNVFENLNEDNYYLQRMITAIIDNNSLLKELKVHMYKGDLITIGDDVFATEKGGLYTIPYYVFAEKKLHSKICSNSGKRAGVWGDTGLGNCYCGAKGVAYRTEEKIKYKTWNGNYAYRYVYVYSTHERIVTETKYNYTYNIEDGVGDLEYIYYAKENDV